MAEFQDEFSLAMQELMQELEQEELQNFARTGTATGSVIPARGQAVRSANNPLADVVGRFVSPGAGRAVHNTMDFAAQPARDIVEMAKRGGRDAAEGVRRGDPLQVAGGVGQAGLAAIGMTGAGGPFGRLVSSVPRAVGTGLAGAGSVVAGGGVLKSKPAQASDDIGKLESRLDGLVSQRAEQEEIRRVNSSRPGPKFRAAVKEIKRLDSLINRAETRIDQARQRNSPEAVAKREAAAREAKQKADLEFAKKPFRERNPELTERLGIAGNALAFAAPLGVKTGKGLASFLPGTQAGRTASAIRRGERTLSQQAAKRGKPNKGTRSQAFGQAVELEELAKEGDPRLWKEIGETVTLAISGGALGTKVSQAPAIMDVISNPDPETRADALKQLLGPEMWEQILVNSIIGLSGAEFGRHVGRKPNSARARGVARSLRELSGTQRRK